jgi:hypothetical protein
MFENQRLARTRLLYGLDVLVFGGVYLRGPRSPLQQQGLEWRTAEVSAKPGRVMT